PGCNPHCTHLDRGVHAGRGCTTAACKACRATRNCGSRGASRWQNRQTQEWEEQVSFFDVKCWAQLGQNVSDSLSKGNRVVVTGRLDQRSWETDQGDKRSTVEIVAEEVGASLLFATADITRNERREGDAAPNNAGGGATRPAQNQAPAGYDPAEEPF
ncbi:MAG: single-stranded DNA-binding protein, partial [Acidimicrobiales bacterium]